MNEQRVSGISRQGLDEAFEAEEARKSNLLLEAQLLRAQEQDDEAAAKFAEAAHIEERLAAQCESKGLREKSWIHQFSAAGCWAQAGNFYEALRLGDELLTDQQLPPRLRDQVQTFTQAIRRKRAQWHAEQQAVAAG